VLFDAAAHHVKLRGFTPSMVLEHKVRSTATPSESVADFVASVASSKPVPGGGSVAAHVGALAAALAQMVSGLTVGRKKYAAVEAQMRTIAEQAASLTAKLSHLVQADADSYARVSAAYKLPKDDDAQTAARDAAIQAALVEASIVPLETARLCAEVAALAAECARTGNTNAVSDAGVAALLAEAAAKGAGYNVRINAQSMTDKSHASMLVAQALEVVEQASAHARDALSAVDAALQA
jgi:glutamate formiminotransferase/formiminotetrahydrofolate cyclodeaminase